MWTQSSALDQNWAEAFPLIDVEAAARRIAGRVERTPLVPLPSPTPALEILGKLENRQLTGSFKARGALNNVAQLREAERQRGVVASSSGNHGLALAWAASASGVLATIVMPKDAYPNKIEACRSHGAQVVLAEDRWSADDIAKELADSGLVWIHPYDRAGTVEGAGTVGLEIAEDAPELDAVVVCVGGGGLSAGTALALRRKLGHHVVIIGAEPEGAAAMEAALMRGESVRLATITSEIQGLTTPYAGHLNVAINSSALDAIMTVPDGEIYAAQRVLVNEDPAIGWAAETVEPAGAAAFAVVRASWFEPRLRQIMVARGIRRAAAPSLRVAVTISGGNPAPLQLAGLRS
ncbi:Phenylserine dehydratase [Planctomycetes bacterium Poly30]|uniref:Phenylserine dehydratase n=1 Tax=Saltatorellus ferox TaxID=2528018 RepID=A0A518EXT2_9BACT|nr:Phenylserine dehydratase [Planctomycetes bacterium Poly30]